MITKVSNNNNMERYIHRALSRLKNSQDEYVDLKNLVNDILKDMSYESGAPFPITEENLLETIENLPMSYKYSMYATTVNTSAQNTQNIISNNHIRILGSDMKEYTLEEWNKLFADAGYDSSIMDITPKGLTFDLPEWKETYLFDRFTDKTYIPTGASEGAEGKLQHSLHNHTLVTSTDSGTDFTTNKDWAVTEEGGKLVLSEENTGQSWVIAKNTGGVKSLSAGNIADRLHSLWAQNEWMRHRMAIDSGLTTVAVDGTMAEVSILNSSGQQAAVGEDMYFWIGGVDTNIKAKYNLNNRHTVNSANFTQAIADAIYDAQVANGVNMNDTGVNSDTKPILAPGSKGAEAIAVNGKWMIITPFINNANATIATATNNFTDSPAVYWAKFKEYLLPSDTLLFTMYLNLSMAQAYISYLNNIEGRSISTIPTTDYIWSGVRYSATSAWYVTLVTGYLSSYNTYNRYFVVGSLAS